MTRRQSEFLKNACVMAAAAVLMRTVSVSYQAYLSSRMGAEGMGLFTLTMSIYSFAITFATSGIQLAVTRLVSECLGRGEVSSAKSALRHATWYALGFSLVGAVLLFFGAPFVGTTILGDARTVLSVRILALTLPPIALCGVMGGYFTAVRRVMGHSATQVVEMGVRIFTTVYLIGYLSPFGLEYSCAAVVAGGAVAQMISCLLLGLGYWFDRRRYLVGNGGDTRGITRRLCHIALPVALSAYIRSGLLTVEHILIPRALTSGGRRTKEEALSTYGVLQGMALPVVLYPMAVLSSFSGLLVPVFAEHNAREEGNAVNYIASRALHMTSVFAVGCTALFAVFAYDLGISLYGSPLAGNYILYLAPVVPLMFLDHVTDCALKGLGEQVWSMWVNIADSLLSILLVLLILPHFGAVGYIWVIVLAEAFNFSLSIGRLAYTRRLKYSFLTSLIFPALAAGGAVWLVRVLMPLDPYTVTLPWLLAEMLLALVAYVAVLCLMDMIARLFRKPGVYMTLFCRKKTNDSALTFAPGCSTMIENSVTERE